MNKLAFIAVAAGAALLPAGALAQQAAPGASAGHSFRHVGPNVTVRHGGRHVRHPGGPFRHHRLQRGFFIHPFWFGPQFHVQNWQLYGFTPPPRDHRWVRHYDDAYLIDREGRVRDTRYGLDWDEYGERWEMDEGIPRYYGRDEWRPDERDYAWVEAYERPGSHEGWDYGDYGRGGDAAYGYAQPYPMPAPSCHPAPPRPCGGYGYGYYGYGYAYPIIIETTVTTGTSYVEEVVEEEIYVRERPRRQYRPPAQPRPRAPAPRRPAPRPPAGERG